MLGTLPDMGVCESKPNNVLTSLAYSIARKQPLKKVLRPENDWDSEFYNRFIPNVKAYI